MQTSATYLTQKFSFCINMQCLEVSHVSNVDLMACKLVIQSKKGWILISNVHCQQLNGANVQQIQSYYKIDIANKITINQKLVEKEKGAGFGDYNLKLLFYLQHLTQMHLLGQSSINLAYYPNASLTQHQEKKFLTSTNDKRAALYFDITVVQGDQDPSDKSEKAHSALRIDANESSVESFHNFQTPMSNLSYRGKSIENDPVSNRLKVSLSQHETSEPQKKATNKIIKIGQHTKNSKTEHGPQIPALKLDNASKDPKSNRLRSPPSTARDQGSSKSIDKLIRPSKPMVSPSRPTPQSQKVAQLKPRPNSPQPYKYPDQELSTKLNTLADKFNTSPDPQEVDLQGQLSELDRKIMNKKGERHEPSPAHVSPLETELSRTVNLLREENDKLRDQIHRESTEQLVRKQMQQQIHLKNQEILQLRRKLEETQLENMELNEKLATSEMEKQEIQELVQKVRYESDQQIQQLTKMMQENKRSKDASRHSPAGNFDRNHQIPTKPQSLDDDVLN